MTNEVKTQYIVTADFLDDHPECTFVFGDNTVHRGHAGAARLRWHPQALGFITKKYPNNHEDSFYTIKEYKPVFKRELAKLVKLIEAQPKQRFLISKLGSGLANKNLIYETIIEPELIKLSETYKNVELVF